MEALFAGDPPVDTAQSESIANIIGRYTDIVELFPDDLVDGTLLTFVDWLVDNVHLIEITAYSDADAYTIFETMNDRGLSLTQAEMLKGYLLKNIEIPEQRTRANEFWRERVRALTDFGRGEDADAIKSWLRSQYAATIRERKRNAAPGDFDLIGTEFHRWVRRNATVVGLSNNADFVRFIERDFSFYGRWYERLRRAADTLTPGLECVHFNAQHKFTLQYPLLLAPLDVHDDEAVVLRKLRVVAAWIDILIHRRIWNWRAFDYSTMQYAMFLVMRDIRGKDLKDLVATLRDRLDAETEGFVVNDRNVRFGLHNMNGPQVHRLLARMTDYVETMSGQPSRYAEYAHRGRGGYEIEHIWANHPELHENDFGHPSEFTEYRNHIGGLLLLPKSFNASYGDLPYADKRAHYLEHNLLARSLHEQAYDHNPGFRKFVADTGLAFRPHERFGRTDLDDRQDLYRQLAFRIWDPVRLTEEVES